MNASRRFSSHHLIVDQRKIELIDGADAELMTR